jgi:hypothetical protein
MYIVRPYDEHFYAVKAITEEPHVGADPNPEFREGII